LKTKFWFYIEEIKMITKRVIVSIIVLATAGSFAVAVPVSVGTGVNTAGVYIEWSDGFIAEFEVSFGKSSADTVTGAYLMLTLDSELADFTFEYTNWGSPEQPDLFIDGLGYQGHYDSGFGGGDDWWHYWTKDAGQSEWNSPMYGMSGRIVADADMDGWIYGRGGAPLPEPASIGLLIVGTLMMRRKKEKLRCSQARQKDERWY
jgi:hypothetical protein